MITIDDIKAMSTSSLEVYWAGRRLSFNHHTAQAAKVYEEMRQIERELMDRAKKEPKENGVNG